MQAVSIEPAAARPASRLKLHVGGIEPRAGWTIVNIMDGPHVDILGSATDLSMFEDGSVDEIYASHILEHLSYMDELPTALREFVRVLKPGGALMTAVPDLDILCRLFISPQFGNDHRFYIMRMMMGGQINAFDFHKTAFTYEFMSHFLTEAGFRHSERVRQFGLFDDGSEHQFMGVPISLNVKAIK